MSIGCILGTCFFDGNVEDLPNFQLKFLLPLSPPPLHKRLRDSELMWPPVVYFSPSWRIEGESNFFKLPKIKLMKNFQQSQKFILIEPSIFKFSFLVKFRETIFLIFSSTGARRTGVGVWRKLLTIWTEFLTFHSQFHISWVFKRIYDDAWSLCNRWFEIFSVFFGWIFMWNFHGLNHSIVAIELRKFSFSKEIFWLYFYLFLNLSLTESPEYLSWKCGTRWEREERKSVVVPIERFHDHSIHWMKKNITEIRKAFAKENSQERLKWKPKQTVISSGCIQACFTSRTMN